MDDEVKVGTYKHFKGNSYKVLGVARNSENPEEEFVVYLALYKSKDFGENQLWIRPKKMFIERVKVGETEKPRFEYIGP